jgi:class 3 adenylate cyclase
VATVDLAIHVGEVLYGNVGATDRLDFTVIGPAVNEVARMETLRAKLGVPVLVSAPVAAAVEGAGGRLKSPGLQNTARREGVARAVRVDANSATLIHPAAFTQKWGWKNDQG